MSANIISHVEADSRTFDESPISDVDLLVLSALLYAEFERFEALPASVRIGDLPEYASARELVEHDCNPHDMERLVCAVVASPRYAGVQIERFECIVDEGRVIQFAAACYVLGNGEVVVAYRGTDSKLVGWHEDFLALYLEAMPGQAEALRYAHEAAEAYPGSQLVLCGHSKGGSEAEYAAVFADCALASRIGRAVSFDGPALFKNGGAAAPELEAFDLALLERYRDLSVPVTRYIFPSKIGLVMERRDPLSFRYTVSVNPARDHNACSAKVVDGELELREPDEKPLCDALGLTGVVSGFTADERRIIVDEVVAACRDSGISIDLTEKGLAALLAAVRVRYRTLPRERKRVFRKAFAKALLNR